MGCESANVVYLNDAYARMREADVILRERVILERNRAFSDFEYAQAVMDLQIKELVWAKRWNIK